MEYSSLPPTARTILIGDVHGCLSELQGLLSQCLLRPGDQLIFMGDLIQKGPDSAGVLRLVQSLRQTYTVRLLLGNHEEKFLRYLHHRDHDPKALAQMTALSDFEVLAAQLSAADIDLLQAGYYALRLPEAGLLLVHGGIPASSQLDLANRDYPYAADYPRDTKKALQLLTKTRHLSPQGHFVALGQENAQTRFWAETYDGRYGTVVFGHQPFMQPLPYRFAHAIGLDTACVYGGWLCACMLDGTELEFVCVKAKMEYARNVFN